MYANMSRDERDARCVRGYDQYIIDHQWFFVRGCLEIPITGSRDPFLWGLWVSVREEVFDEIEDVGTWREGRSLTAPSRAGLPIHWLSILRP
jgi:hypothetical protein